jgi:superoxide dismutase, Fe-Mn family
MLISVTGGTRPPMTFGGANDALCHAAATAGHWLQRARRREILARLGQPQPSHQPATRKHTMKYRISPLFCRPWTLNGISPRLIESHYENNYGAALNRLNAVTAELERRDVKATAPQVLGRLRQEQTTLLNSTLLHELYFASLGGDGRSLPDTMSSAIARDFGSVDHWRQEFMALAEALAGDSGWVLLTYVPRDGRLMNQCATDHAQSIAGGFPILALDMYEHAYHLEFGANQTAYVAAFMRNIHWSAVETRYLEAAKVAAPLALHQPEFGDLPSIAPEEVQAMLAAGKKVQIIDTRPRHYTTKSNDIVAGAVWRDPERIEEWIGTLSKDEPVVTFCVYGFHIGCQSAAALRDAGFDARYMSGGHTAWKAIDGAVERLE